MTSDKPLRVSEEEAKKLVQNLAFVSRETKDRLEAYAAELERWNRAINLVSPREIARLWSRHILDSLGMASLLTEGGLWLDIGSGGGFPAIPLAIVSRETRNGPKFVLVESDQRKGAFLREVIRKLALNAEVEIRRVEDLEPKKARLISARALAELNFLLSWTENQRASGAKMVLLKGEKAFDELTAASAEWHMRYQAERHPLTRNGYMLIIREAKRAKLR